MPGRDENIMFNHKYMISDKSLYIGTSNWAADYFLQTAGVGLVVHSEHSITTTNNSSQTLLQQLTAVFERDWNSSYVWPLEEAIDKCNANQLL